LSGYDAATVVEVIEHLDAPRLAAFERVLFEAARPATVIVTTAECGIQREVYDFTGWKISAQRPPV
jgi:hypothetical protein